MKSGFKVVWTDHALDELGRTFEYLESNFSERECRRLADKLESVLSLIAAQPRLYPESGRLPNVRRAVILQFNSLYYRVKDQQIEILSFFSNRQDPNGIRIE